MAHSQGLERIRWSRPCGLEDLLALRDWLAAHGVTRVAMESTGVYWKAVYYLLEDAFTVLLVNAQHMKNVPGRKTDVRNCAVDGLATPASSRARADRTFENEPRSASRSREFGLFFVKKI